MNPIQKLACMICHIGQSKPPDNLMLKWKVVDKLEEDILIHEHWAAYVTEHPEYAASMGDYDWHMEWNRVYKSALYYLRV